MSEVIFNSDNEVLNTTAKLVDCLVDDGFESFKTRYNVLSEDLKEGVSQQLEFFDHLYDSLGMTESTELYQVTQLLK